MTVSRDLVLDDLTPEELAVEFFEMDDEQQARFFSYFGKLAVGNADAPEGSRP